MILELFDFFSFFDHFYISVFVRFSQKADREQLQDKASRAWVDGHIHRLGEDISAAKQMAMGAVSIELMVKEICGECARFRPEFPGWVKLEQCSDEEAETNRLPPFLTCHGYRRRSLTPEYISFHLKWTQSWTGWSWSL